MNLELHKSTTKNPRSVNCTTVGSNREIKPTVQQEKKFVSGKRTQKGPGCYQDTLMMK